jgi:hypothetical protein
MSDFIPSNYSYALCFYGMPFLSMVCLVFLWYALCLYAIYALCFYGLPCMGECCQQAKSSLEFDFSSAFSLPRVVLGRHSFQCNGFEPGNTKLI